MAQLMLLPLTVSCFSKIQIGFTFLVPATQVVPEKGPLNGCVCVCILSVPEWLKVHRNSPKKIHEISEILPNTHSLDALLPAYHQHTSNNEVNTELTLLHH